MIKERMKLAARQGARPRQ